MDIIDSADVLRVIHSDPALFFIISEHQGGRRRSPKDHIAPEYLITDGNPKPMTSCPCPRSK